MKNFVVQNSFITFAALEPAKPLNDAQIGGSFFLYTHENKFQQTIFIAGTNRAFTKTARHDYKRRK